MSKVKEELDHMTVTGNAGGDMVKAEISGNHEVKSIIISKEIINPDDVEMLQDLVIAAVNDGLRKATELAQNEMAKLTGGINIPGLNLNNLI